MVQGSSAATKVRSEYPLRLMLPEMRSAFAEDPLLCFMLSFGGGLVAGDSVRLDVAVGRGGGLVLASQGTTKVYKSRGLKGTENGPASQHLECTVAAGGFLALVPEPTTCFREARFHQSQRFQLAADGSSSLILADWWTAGRSARGEAWDLSFLKATTQVLVGDQVVLHEAMELEGDPPDTMEGDQQLPSARSLAHRMGAATVFGFLLMVGPHAQAACAHLRDAQKRKSFEQQKHIGHNQAIADPWPLVAVSDVDFRVPVMSTGLNLPCRESGSVEGATVPPTVVGPHPWSGSPCTAGCMLRFAASRSTEGYKIIRDALGPLESQVLGRLAWGSR